MKIIIVMWLCTQQKKGARGFGKMLNTNTQARAMNKATVASLKACHLVKIETELTNMTQATMPEKKITGLRQRTVVE